MNLFKWAQGLTPKAPTSKTIGNSGEALAVKFLKRRGYRILEQNFRCRQGEIDIIAREGDTICFVEVKTRSSVTHGSGTEVVAWHKQRKLVKTALFYLNYKRMTDYNLRFDVISILLQEKEDPQIEFVENAFEPDEY